MAQRRINEETGQVFELTARGWVDVTPTQAERDAEGISAIDAFTQTAVGTAGNVFDSARDLSMRMQELAPDIGVPALGTEDRIALQARILADTTERDAMLAAVQAERPFASFLGGASVFAPLMAIPIAGPGTTALGTLGRVAAREAMIGAGEGFLSRPGTMAERVRNAALTGALAGAGGGIMAGTSMGVNATRTAARNSTDVLTDTRATAEAALSSRNIELEMETGVPRLGEDLAREYDRVASRAVVPDTPPQLTAASRGAVGLDPFHRELVRQADDLGIALTTGQRTGIESLQRIEASLGSTPLTSKPFDDLRAHNQRVLNQLAARAMGESVPYASARVSGSMLGRAQERISAIFESVADAVDRVPLDADLSRALTETVQKHARGIARSGDTEKLVQDVFRLAGENGEPGARFLTGRQVMDGRSALTRELQRASNAGDGNTMLGIYEIIDALDDAFARAASDQSGDVMGRWKIARDQWRIKDALEQGKAVTTGGNVKAATLDGVLRRRYAQEYLRGGTGVMPIFDAVKILTEFRDIVGDSGTATRMAAMNMLESPVKTAIRGTVGRAAGAALQSRTGGAAAARLSTGSDLFRGAILADPSRSATRLGSIAGIAAGNQAIVEDAASVAPGGG